MGILQLGRVTEEVAHPVVKARIGSSQLSSTLQIFSLPHSLPEWEPDTRPARAQTAKKTGMLAQEMLRKGTCVRKRQTSVQICMTYRSNKGKMDEQDSHTRLTISFHLFLFVLFSSYFPSFQPSPHLWLTPPLPTLIFTAPVTDFKCDHDN